MFTDLGIHSFSLSLCVSLSSVIKLSGVLILVPKNTNNTNNAATAQVKVEWSTQLLEQGAFQDPLGPPTPG
jgi:hypothetical protein